MRQGEGAKREGERHTERETGRQTGRERQTDHKIRSKNESWFLSLSN